MHSEPPGRYINSVSDLYETDEIEFLLDDIRELEPVSCKPEDIQCTNRGKTYPSQEEADGMSCVLQDFEIAGSGTECVAGGCQCDSPVDTVNSWDSHSHYRRRGASPDLSLYSGVIVYCDHHHLKTPTGVVRVLLVITTVACLTCLCTSGTVKVGLFMLPLAGRIRFMMFSSLFSLLVTCLFLFLDISHVIYLFPFNWGKINAYLYLSLSILFLIASSLIFHMIFVSESFSWVPKWTHHQLLATGCLGYICCLQTAVLALIQKFTQAGYYQPVTDDQQQQERELQILDDRRSIATAMPTHNYKPLANKQQKPEEPSYLLDDIQPCSSKSADPYRIA